MPMLRPIEFDKHIHIVNDSNGSIHFYAWNLTDAEVEFADKFVDAVIENLKKMREERENP